VQRLGQLSADGKKYWDSQQWVSAISRDGNWQWDGRSWISVPSAEHTTPPASVLIGAAEGSGFFNFPGFQRSGRTTAAVAVALLLLQFVVSLAAFELGVRSIGENRQIAAVPWVPIWWPTPQPTTPSPSPVVVAIRRPAPAPPEASSRATPSPLPTPSPTPPPPPPPPPTCGAPANPFGYDFCAPASLVYRPAAHFCRYFDCIASFWINTNGYVVECVDRTFSHRGGHPGACFNHGGVRRPLYS
jgi:hypothetical protein